MKQIILLSLLLLGCYSKENAGKQVDITGKVIKIVDGDTYDILLAVIF